MNERPFETGSQVKPPGAAFGISAARRDDTSRIVIGAHFQSAECQQCRRFQVLEFHPGR